MTNSTPKAFDWNDLTSFKKDKRFPENYPENLRTFWAGSDDVHGLIVSLLKSAHNDIVLNMFGFDLDDADQILRDKMLNDHIFVQMSLDKTQAGGVHEREILKKWPVGAIGTTIAIGQSVHHAISHLKVCIVDGLYVITGSTNWSLSGTDKQDNELRLFRDPVVAHEARTVLDINHTVMQAQMVKAGQAALITGGKP